MINNIVARVKSITRVEYINYLIMLYAFSISLPQGLKRVTAIAMILFWIADKSRYPKLPQTNIFILFGIFVTYALVSWFWSDASLLIALDYITRYWQYIPIFIIFKYLSKENIKITISMFLLGMFVSEILSYGNFFGLWQVGFGIQTDPTVFCEHTLYSVMLACSSLILLILILVSDEKSHIRKLMYIVFYSTVTLNIFINGGRTGQLALLIVTFFILSMIYKDKILNIFYALLAILIFAVAIYQISPVLQTRVHAAISDIQNINHQNNYSSSIGGRIGFWILSKEIIFEHPIFGMGIQSHLTEAYRLVDEKYKYLPYNKELKHFHSDYLEFITQYGIIGLLLFGLLIYEFAKIPIRDQTIRLIKYSTLSIFLISSFVDIILWANGTINLFALLMGIVLAQYRTENEKAKC